MALNVLQCPTYVAQTGNPIPFHVEAGYDWQNPIAGAVWGFSLEFTSDLVSPGEIITITLNGQEHTIEVIPSAAIKSDNGLQIYENPISNPIASWILAELIPTIAGNWHIYNACTLTDAGNFVFITTPFEYELSVSSDIAGIDVQPTGIGTPVTYPENYRIVASFFVSDDAGATYSKVSGKIAFPEKETPFAAKFELSALLDAYVSPKRPAIYNDTAVGYVVLAALCKVHFAEGWGLPVQYQAINGVSPHFGTNLFYFMAGKSPFMLFPERYQANWITNTLINLFLTNQPSSKRVTSTQQEYLYYFHSGVLPQNMKLRVKVYFTDGSDTSYYTHSATLASCQGIYFPVGYSQLALAAVNPAKVVKKWEVQIVLHPSNTAYSDLREFVLEEKCPNHEKFFLFCNELAGFDTVRCKKAEEFGVETTKSDTAKILDYGYVPEEGSSSTFSTFQTEIGQIETGLISLEYAKYLRELFDSEEVYIIDGGLEKYVPVRILPGSARLYKEDDLFYNVSFNYQYLT